MSAHTKGPWGDERKAVIVRGLTWIAHAHYPSEEGMANAKLIAAAPELLEACQAVANSSMRNEAYDLCVAAIEKATKS